MVSKQFILAGRAVFTVKVGTNNFTDAKPHYTFRIKHKPGTLVSKGVYFVTLLTRPTANKWKYDYVGCLVEETGYTRLTAKSKFSETSTVVKIIRRVLERIWKGEQHVIETAGWDVMHEGQCGRCGRELTVPESIETGIGPECAKHMGIGKVVVTPSQSDEEEEWDA